MSKRVLLQDPEYEAIPAELQEKRIKLMEDSVRKQTKKKIESILKSNLIQEISSKNSEIDSLDEQLQECRTTCDRLRACALTKYYANVGQDPQAPAENNTPSVHPSVKKYLGKCPRDMDSNSLDRPSTSATETSVNVLVEGSYERISSAPSSSEANKQLEAQSLLLSPSKDISSRAPRFKTKSKIVIGNISKFIPVWQRDESDQSTHKWMIYVRGDKDNPNIESFVKKVRFLLHPSYRPTDVVEIYNPPFHLVKRGWGEFPVRVQLHFHDPRNKPVDIIHNLKLDKTYTGLQTLGAETVVELQLFKADAITHNVCSISTLSSSNLLPASSPHENYESYSESNSNSLVPIKMEIESDSETSVKTSSADSIQPFERVQNHTLTERHPIENNSEALLIDSAADENLPSPSVNRTITPKPVLPNSFPNSSTTNKPLKAAGPNGVNTTYLKCTDTEGRVLLVPQTSLLCIKSQKLTPKKINNLTANSALSTDGADKLRESKSSVPSYILKVVPNQDSGQNQVLLIPMSEKKVQCPSNTFSNDTQTKCVLKPNNVLDNGHSEEETPERKQNPISYWEQELSNIKIEYYKSFGELLKRVCRAFPLVKESVDRSICPYCASSLEEFLRWNIGKQRASEWRRAGMVRTALLNLLKKRRLKYLTEESVWSRSTIMSWCRKNGFVPMTSDKMTLLPEPKWSGIELCSVSNAEDLVSTLKEEDSRCAFDEDEEIDIFEVSNDKAPTVKNNQNQQAHLHLPPSSEASLYVKEIASQIGVNINPLEVEPSMFAPVVEEMVLAACCQLATDLIRSSVNEGYNRMGGQLCPEEITVSDVYSAIKKTPQFDFLTNSNLGVPKEARGDT